LQQYLSELKSTPDIVAITETRLNYTNNHVSNHNLEGYDFYQRDSHTLAGGVGVYVKSSLTANYRDDMTNSTDDFETIWVEISNHKDKLMVGVVYRYPNSNFLAFQDELVSTLHKLSSCNCPYYIIGDININFLKINSNSSVADFKNFTNCYGIHCLINKPTRITDHSSALLDHLYTNESRITIHSGICIWDVSDHYPIFCIIPSTKSYQKCKKLYARDTTLFETEAFPDELQMNMETLQMQDVNTTVSRFGFLFETTLNKHAPLK